MSTTVHLAKKSDKELIQQLDQFYLYEFSRYLPDYYKVAEDGLFHDGDYAEYWGNPGKFPYLVRHCSEIAGFALVKNEGAHFLMDQFFVMVKFQGAGIAESAALSIFEKHPGNWLVQSLISNPKSEGFWPRVIDAYTSGRFDKRVQKPANTHHEYAFTTIAHQA